MADRPDPRSPSQRDIEPCPPIRQDEDRSWLIADAIIDRDAEDRSVTIETWSDLWDALADPCDLPPWFGRNLDAWWDAIDRGGLAALLDDRCSLVIRLREVGLFAPGNDDGAHFVGVTRDCARAAVRLGDT